MGVCIRATNCPIEFNLGYGAFFSLRRNIAKQFGDDFLELYKKVYAPTGSPDEYRENVRHINKLMLNEERFPKSTEKVLYFLFLPDCEGKIDHRGCKEIYDLIKDVNFEGKHFQYIAYRKDESDYELFKEFLKYCYSHRTYMRWS